MAYKRVFKHRHTRIAVSLSFDQLVVKVSKNGRPVSEVNARSFARRHYPGIRDWTYAGRRQHSTVLVAEANWEVRKSLWRASTLSEAA